MMLKRTAKSCRSDAPMLASSLREGAQATVSNKPGHRGERAVKPLRREGRVYSGEPVVTTLVCFIYFAREAAGALATRLSLRPLISLGGWFLQKLGRIAPRERGVLTSLRGATRRSNPPFVIPGWSEGPDLRCAIAHRGISRFRARCGACHRAALCADPLASPRNDGVWIASRGAYHRARQRRDPLAPRITIYAVDPLPDRNRGGAAATCPCQ